MAELSVAGVDCPPARTALRRTVARAAVVVGFAAGAWLAGSLCSGASAQTPAAPPAIPAVSQVLHSPAKVATNQQDAAEISVPVVGHNAVTSVAANTAPIVHEVVAAPVAKVVQIVRPVVQQVVKPLPVPTPVPESAAPGPKPVAEPVATVTKPTVDHWPSRSWIAGPRPSSRPSIASASM